MPRCAPRRHSVHPPRTLNAWQRARPFARRPCPSTHRTFPLPTAVLQDRSWLPFAVQCPCIEDWKRDFRMLKNIVILGFAGAFLASCATNEPGALGGPPSHWNAQSLAHFERQSRPIQCRILLNAAEKYLSDEDQSFVRRGFSSIGLNPRDLEILTDAATVYGTGMSFAGLECAAGANLAKHTAFYPGTGHQWQVRFGTDFVYLRGDGTDRGMKVYAWN